MGILTWIIVGLVAGALAKWFMPGDDPGGIIVTILLGMVGAVVGGFIATALGLGAVTGFNLWSLILAIVGTMVVLLVYRMVFARRTA